MDMGDLYRIMTGRLEPLSVPVKPSDPLPAPDSAKPMPEPPARDLPWDPDPWNA